VLIDQQTLMMCSASLAECLVAIDDHLTTFPPPPHQPTNPAHVQAQNNAKECHHGNINKLLNISYVNDAARNHILFYFKIYFISACPNI